MTFRQALRVLWQQRLLIVAAVIVAVLAAGVYLATRTKEYQAAATVQLNQPAGAPSSTVTGIDPNLQLVTGDSAVRAAGKTLGRTDYDTLRGDISLAFDATNNVVSVVATTKSPETSVKVANAFALAYVGAQQALAVQTQNKLQSQLDVVNKLLTAASAQAALHPKDPVVANNLQSLETNASNLQNELTQSKIAGKPAEVLHLATGAVSTVTSKSKLLAIAALVGLLAGAGLALLRNQFDTKLRTAEDAEDLAERPVLAQLPYVRAYRRGATALPVVDTPRSAFAAAIRELRTSVAVLLASAPVPVLVVTSPAPFDGKTLVTSNLAASWALSGKRTILVSGDLRKPRIHNFFDGSDQDKGLGDILAGHRSSIEELKALLRPTPVEGLLLLPAGYPHGDPADELASAAMRRTVEQLRELADIVIIDSPPVLAAADAAIISANADGVLLIARANRTRLDELAEAVKRLRGGKVNLLGVALNRVKGITGATYGDYYRSTDPVSTRDDDPGSLFDDDREEPEHDRDDVPPARGAAPAPSPVPDPGRSRAPDTPAPADDAQPMAADDPDRTEAPNPATAANGKPAGKPAPGASGRRPGHIERRRAPRSSR